MRAQHWGLVSRGQESLRLCTWSHPRTIQISCIIKAPGPLLASHRSVWQAFNYLLIHWSTRPLVGLLNPSFFFLTFIEHLLCVRHCALPVLSCFILIKTLWSVCSYYICFAEKETELLRGYTIQAGLRVSSLRRQRLCAGVECNTALLSTIASIWLLYVCKCEFLDRR